jgi:biotin carboxyl carrier protein
VKYHVELGGEAVEVVLERDAKGLFALLRGRRIPIEATPLGGGAFSLLMDGRSFEVGVERAGEGLDLWLEGEHCRVFVEDERERIAHGVESSRGEKGRVLKASMPGIVVAVKVTAGATVTKGQPLVIVEAMKMQNSMSADADGVVTRVHVAAGQTVEPGQVLVEVSTVSDTNSSGSRPTS